MKRLLLLLLLLCGPILANPAIVVGAKLNFNEEPLPFGKQAELVISLTWPDKTEFAPPEASELALEGATITDAFLVDLGSDGLQRKIEYHLFFTRFEPGDFVVGPVAIGDTLESPAIKMTFGGSTPKEGDKEGEIRGAKATVELSTWDFWMLFAKYVLGFLLLLLLLSVLINKSGILDRFRSPKSRALRHLKRLKKKHGHDAFDLLAGSVAILRRYLKEAYGISAQHLTSTETMRELKLDNRSSKIRACADDLLSCSDQIKFAGKVLSLPEAEDRFQQFYVVVNQESKVPPK